jgi:HSP20 family protein
MNHNSSLPRLFKAMDQWLAHDMQSFEQKKFTRKVYPATNISENEQVYFLEMIVPGRKKEDFKIEINDNNLEVAYSPKPEEQSAPNESKFILKEFELGSFKRIFKLEDSIQLDSLKASYENGILKIELPKKTVSQPTKRQIEIA